MLSLLFNIEKVQMIFHIAQYCFNIFQNHNRINPKLNHYNIYAIIQMTNY